MTRDELIEAGAQALHARYCPCGKPDRLERRNAGIALGAVLPLVTEAIAETVEEQRRALTDDISSYHGTIRNADDMSWVLAQARDRIVRWVPSDV